MRFLSIGAGFLAVLCFASVNSSAATPSPIKVEAHDTGDSSFLPLSDSLAKGAHKKKTKSSTCVDVNTADLAGLCKLPGVGPAIAQNIIAYRTAHGRFVKPEDMLDVKGIGEVKLYKMRRCLGF